MSTMAQLRTGLMHDVVANADNWLRELGIESSIANHCAHALADHLAEHWGGQVINIPKEHFIKLSARERQIQKLHKEGVDKSTLAWDFGMSMRSINRLLRRAEKRDAVDAQLDLFATEL